MKRQSFSFLLFLFFLFSHAADAYSESRLVGKDADFPALIEEMKESGRALSNDDLTVTADRSQPGSGIENAFDGVVETIWHSPWNEAGAYPFSIEFTFKKPEILEKLWYLPRPNGPNGYLHEYEIWGKKTLDGKWKKVQNGTLPDSGDAKFIAFRPGKYAALRLDILKGHAGFATASEFLLFRLDRERWEIDRLFSDGSFSALRTDKKGKVPADLRKRITELKSKTEDPKYLEELRLAESLLKKPKDLKRKVFQVIPKPSVREEWNTFRTGFPWCGYQPTGLTIEEGEKFAVYVEAGFGDPVPDLVINDLKCGNWNHQARFTLSRGRNYLEAPISGILYLENQGMPNREHLPVIHIENAHFMPFFQLGKTTAKEWMQMCREINLYGMAEFSSQHILITATMENVMKHLDDPVRLLKAYEFLADRYAELMGFSDKDENPIHHRPRCVMHLTEVDHMFMYATSFRTAYHRDAMKPVLNSSEFLKSGWGPWHELGHIHQMPHYCFEGMTEVTVNIYSLHMQTSLRQKARIDTPEMQKKLLEYFARPNRDYHAEEDVFMKLAMFWQLKMAFGDDFYPKLHRYIRENPLASGESDVKVQYFIQAAAEISGRNLEPFFNAWGLPIEPKTRMAMKKLKPLKKPIWLNFNFSNP